MDGRQFDELAPDATEPAGSRRGLVLGLAAGTVGLLGTNEAKASKKAKRRRKRGDVRVCFKGRQLSVDRAAADELVSRGAQLGKCPPQPGATAGAVLWVDVQESQTWSDLGQSTQFGSERHVVDLTGFTQIKVMGVVSKAGQGELRVDWEIDPDTNDFATLVGSIDLDSTGVKQTDYVAIPAQAQGLINIVAAAAGGSGNSPETRGVAIMALA